MCGQCYRGAASNLYPLVLHYPLSPLPDTRSQGFN